MADILTEMPLKKRKPGVSKIDKYLDGQVWQLKKGRDFQGDPQRIVSLVAHIRKRRGWKIACRLDRTEGTVVLQRLFPSIPAPVAPEATSGE